METQGIDLKSLEELGFVHDAPISGRYEFRDFSIGVGPVPGTRIDLSAHGLRSNKARTRTCRRRISWHGFGPIRCRPAELFARCHIGTDVSLSLAELSPLPEGDQVFPSVTISISHRRNASPLPWEERLVGYRASSRLRQVLSWARSALRDIGQAERAAARMDRRRIVRCRDRKCQQ